MLPAAVVADAGAPGMVSATGGRSACTPVAPLAPDVGGVARLAESAIVLGDRGVLLVGNSTGGATMTIAVSSNAMKKRLSIDGRAWRRSASQGTGS
jgi:hypothetical protein